MKKFLFSCCLLGMFSVTMNAQTVLADFEDGGLIPTFYNQSGDNVVCTVSLVNNPDKSGLNTTNKSLHARTNSEKMNAWWGGPRIDFNTPFTVDENKKYLHVMVKTNLPKYEFLVFFGDKKESWAGTFNPTETGWFDYVIDLTDVKGQDDLSGQSIKGIRVALSVNDEGQQDKDLYLDEIIVNNSSTPRTSSGTSSVHDTNLLFEKVYVVGKEIILQDISGEVKVFDTTGRCVHQSIATGNTTTIKLPAGLYLFTTGKLSKKLLVK